MSDSRRFAPATLRNRGPIVTVLTDWLPLQGLVLEIASGSGEHAVHFAKHFADLSWQPSDPDPAAINSITAWRDEAHLDNLRAPLSLDAASAPWPVERADAIVTINMVHISAWEASLGLLDGAARLLPAGAPLILYGPWIEQNIAAAPSNLAFDQSLKARDPRWGLRTVEAFADEASARGLKLCEKRSMPANNLMLLFRRH
ncbi:MAG TPA: DUF938 domain-containing protein [Sphingomicrobium sp.]|nr:DUF938 domain-containing protein [Sphingomicrobium sp.]